MSRHSPRQKPTTFAAYKRPLSKDMRCTARELGIVGLLMEHQRIVLQRPAEAWDLVEDVLIRLGVSNAELLANLEGPKDV